MKFRLLWCSDIHLNFVDDHVVSNFCAGIMDKNPGAVVITGDIAEAPSLRYYLGMVHAAIERPVFVVLGNHDYYRSSWERVDTNLREFLPSAPRLKWLSESSIVPLTEQACLIGHDSWYDCTLGNAEHTPVRLTDFNAITDLALLSFSDRMAKCRARAKLAADHFANLLPKALDQYEHVIAAMHVPPFAAASTYQGRQSEPNYLPYFTCDAVGRVLKTAMSDRPNKKMTVLCGHSHGRADVEVLPNLRVLAAEAEYGEPRIADVLEID